MKPDPKFERNQSPRAQGSPASRPVGPSPIDAINPAVAQATAIRIEGIRQKRRATPIVRQRYLTVFAKHAEAFLGTTTPDRIGNDDRLAA